MKHIELAPPPPILMKCWELAYSGPRNSLDPTSNFQSPRLVNLHNSHIRSLGHGVEGFQKLRGHVHEIQPHVGRVWAMEVSYLPYPSKMVGSPHQPSRYGTSKPMD